MQDFDYVIIGGGCAGLSLAYSLEINNRLKSKSLAIIEPREKYERDKSWSFWKTFDHNFDDCVKKSWNHFEVKKKNGIQRHATSNYPYQCIDSGLFYEKILNALNKNKNISFFKDSQNIDIEKSIVFNSVTEHKPNNMGLYQHFQGYEIELEENFFNDSIFTLMDFNCDQRKSVHFFYVLPFTPKSALIESTWISAMEDPIEQDYSNQISDYIENVLKIKHYKISYSEIGKIPLFSCKLKNSHNIIHIGTSGGMTRLSTGYTFLNIQKHSDYLQKNMGTIEKIGNFTIRKKYLYLDNLFLRVLKNYPERMIDIFYQMFGCKTDTIIRFLSEEENILEDAAVIQSMPKKIFINSLWRK